MQQIFWPFISQYPEALWQGSLNDLFICMMYYNRLKPTDDVIPLANAYLWVLRNPNIHYRTKQYHEIVAWTLRDLYRISGAHNMAFYELHVYLKQFISQKVHLQLAVAHLKLQYKDKADLKIKKYKQLRKNYLEAIKL